MSGTTDQPRLSTQYDEEEATQILAGHLESLGARASPDRAAAANLLFAETAALCRELKYEVKLADTLELRTGDGHAAHAWYAEGDIFTVGSFQARRTGDPRPLPLRFNPVTRRLEGLEEDSYRVPVPGQPRARRSAKAVLAQALVAALSEQAQEHRHVTRPDTGYSTR
ncbi:MAG TPA: hypothetical protein VFA20_18470 [Myxococcaceae bacterium]|nr:hypothetical protein [Myxococcaceae bacterium]